MRGVVLLALVTLALASTRGVLEAGPIIDDTPAGRPATGSNARERRIATTKATCPFMGSIVQDGTLKWSGSVKNPHAKLDDIERIGNSANPAGKFGDLLRMFALGNHGFDRSGRATPNDKFSLDFPFSQGSHHGDSGILQDRLFSPQFSMNNFVRLKKFASADGTITKRQMGHFIANRVEADEESTTIGSGTVWRSGIALFRTIGKSFEAYTFAKTPTAKRAASKEFTKLLATDNIAGSAGEWALMFALFQNRNDGRKGGVLYMDEMFNMFAKKKLPANWEKWERNRSDWAIATLRITTSAYNAFAKSKVTDASDAIVDRFNAFMSYFKR